MQDDDKGYAVLTQAQLDDLIRLHEKFLSGDSGGSRMIAKFMDLSGLTFRGRNLKGADFTGSILKECNLAGANFEAASFFSADLSKADLQKGKFRRADFRGAILGGANLYRADLQKTDLREGVIMKSNQGTGDWGDYEKPQKQKAIKKTQHNTIFSGAKLTKANLSGTRAVGADFSETNMTGTIFQDSDLRESCFINANISHADLSGSDLRKANLKGTIMIGTVLKNIEAQGLDLSDAITEEIINKTMSSLEQPIETLIDMHELWLNSNGGEGHQLDLSYVDLRSQTQLKGRVLTALKADGANCVHLDLSETQIQCAYFERADLRDAVIRLSDMRGTSFKHANMGRIDLTGSDLSSLQVHTKDGLKAFIKTNFTGVNLQNAVLRNVNLQNTVLSGANLSHCDLTACDLRGADLVGAKLDGSNINDALTD